MIEYLRFVGNISIIINIPIKITIKIFPLINTLLIHYYFLILFILNKAYGYNDKDINLFSIFYNNNNWKNNTRKRIFLYKLFTKFDQKKISAITGTRTRVKCLGSIHPNH